MHKSVMDYLRESITSEDVHGKRVLEIGSIFWRESPRDVVMPLNPSFYIGIDERPGQGVDEVLSADNLDIRFESQWFDAVICTEVLEHAKNWRQLIQQILRVLRVGGSLFITCRAPGYPYHEEPNDFWRFTCDDISNIFKDHMATVWPDPECPGVFAIVRKMDLPAFTYKPVDLYQIRPAKMYPPSHHLSVREKKIDPKIKFTVITPTVLRPSLHKACKSLERQDYPNWEHIVMVDMPGSPVPTWLEHPQRKIFVCDQAHRNVGNTCRHDAFPHITGDYVVYLDDDNHYHKRSLSLLADAIMSAKKEVNWGIFPMVRMGQIFFNFPPGKNRTDTGQFFHKPVINGVPIQYLATNDYAADGELVELLKKSGPPYVVDPKIPLINMPVRSFGLVSGAGEYGENYSVLIPNRYDDIIRPLLESIERNEPDPKPNILIIADNHSRRYGYNTIRVDGEDFSFAKNVNIGIQQVYPNDVILLNDDIRLIMPVFRELRAIMERHPKIGILSPLIDGGVGNKKQSAEHVLTRPDPPGELTYIPCTADDFICFPMVYLRGKMLSDIGLMDEEFRFYGRDDADMCIRAVKAGWKAAVYNRVVVMHGIGGSDDLRGKNWNTSFHRRPELLDGPDYFTKKYSSKKAL